MSLDLAGPSPAFDLYDTERPIISQPQNLPPALIVDADLSDSLVGCGSVINKGCVVTSSVLGNCVYLEPSAIVDRSLILGSFMPYHHAAGERAAMRIKGRIPHGVGMGTVLQNVVADHNVSIGRNCVITNAAGVKEANRELSGYVINSGLVVILKGEIIPDSTII